MTLGVQFTEEGIGRLGAVLPKDKCSELLSAVKQTRAFGDNLFVDPEVYRANPQHRGTNPGPGCNLTEKFDLDWIEKHPSITDALHSVLGPYRIFHKKFVVGIPSVPDWVAKEVDDIGVANLGGFVRPEYRDMTYFRGIDFHQDIIDHKARSADFVTLYIYLDDVDASASPLHVIPGSHVFGATKFPHHLMSASNGTGVEYGDGNGRQCELKYEVLTGESGTTYFWHSLILHGTKPQQDSRPRISLRYLIERDNPFDRLTRNVDGPLSLTETRVDIDHMGRAILKGNTVNRTG